MNEKVKAPLKGNRFAVSLESFLVFSFVSVLAVPLAISTQLSMRNFAISISIGITSTTFMGLFIFLANKTTHNLQKSFDRTSQFLITLTIIALAGAFRGVILYFSFDFAQFIQPSGLINRIISSCATTLFWLSLCSLVIEDTRVFRRRFENILKSTILTLAQDIRTSNKTMFSRELDTELSQIDIRLNKVFDEAKRATVNTNNLRLAASQVRDIVNESIRPLSHRLWLDQKMLVPKIKLKETIIESIRHLNVPALPTALFILLTSVFNLTSEYGALRGIIGSTTVFVIPYLFFHLYQRFARSKMDGNFYANLVVLFLPGVLTGLVLYVTNEFYLKNDSGLLGFVYIGIVLVVALLASVRNLSRSDREDLLEILSSAFQRSSAATVREDHGLEVASYLHNALQSELLALSYQLEQSALNPNVENSRAILEQMGSRINRSISNDFAEFHEEPLKRLERVQVAWKGIVSVDLKLDPLILNDSAQNLLLVQIIDESISNAVRYARAKSIWIEISKTEDGSKSIIIRNDGLELLNGSIGMGSEWLDSFTGGRWSRTHDGRHTILELLL